MRFLGYEVLGTFRMMLFPYYRRKMSVAKSIGTA
jgi:hypothetical protein